MLFEVYIVGAWAEISASVCLVHASHITGTILIKDTFSCKSNNNLSVKLTYVHSGERSCVNLSPDASSYLSGDGESFLEKLVFSSIQKLITLIYVPLCVFGKLYAIDINLITKENSLSFFFLFNFNIANKN